VGVVVDEEIADGLVELAVGLALTALALHYFDVLFF
jgi:hypothetical protein